MKKLRVFALLCIAALMLAGCTTRNNNNGNTQSVIPPVTSTPIVSPANNTPVPNNNTNDIRDNNGTVGSAIDNTIDNVEDRVDDTLNNDRNDVNDRINDNTNNTGNNVNNNAGLDNTIRDNERAVTTMSTDFNEIGALDAQKKGWGPGGPTDKLKRPDGATVYQDRYGKYDAFFIGPNTNKVYLTFDEGYENSYTAPILDTLKEKNVKAVFFITLPYAKTEPALVKRMIEEGHTLGNHSSKHLSFPDMPLTEAADDIQKLHEYMKETYHYEMKLFRPPMGEFSEQTLALTQALGYKSVFWSFAYRDWLVDDQPLTIEALSNLTQKSHPGAIYLLHAVSQTNAEILGEAIDNIRSLGYEIAAWDL